MAQSAVENPVIHTTPAVEAPAADRPDVSRLSLLAVGHAVTDSYGWSLLSPMLPELRRSLGLSLGHVGAQERLPVPEAGRTLSRTATKL